MSEGSRLGRNLSRHVQSINMIRSAIQARAVANEVESRKRSKNASLTDRFDFQPIAVETSGMFECSVSRCKRQVEITLLHFMIFH